jgi:hypothetical protein
MRFGLYSLASFAHFTLAKRPNGLRYRRLGEKMLRNGKLRKLRNISKKRAESQPSGARFVGLPSCIHVTSSGSKQKAVLNNEA